MMTIPTAGAAQQLSTAQVALIIAGATLAIVAAIVTNVIVAKRGRAKAEMDDEIGELDEQLQRAHAALSQSLAASRSARMLWALVELPPVPPDALYENYFHTVVGWFAQAGMDAIGGLGLEIRNDVAPDETPELQKLLRARQDASVSGPIRLQGLVDAGDSLRESLVPHSVTLVKRRSEQIRRRSEYETTTSRILAGGTSIQILSLIAIVARDLL